MERPFPVLSVEQLRDLDRRAVSEWGIPIRTLMENAGRAVADESLKFLSESGMAQPWKILILCGSGNNGGDGLVAARLLHQKGISVQTLLLKPAERFKNEPLDNFEELRRLQIPWAQIPDGAWKPESGTSLLIDALLGTGFKGPADAKTAGVIEAANASGIPVIAVDVPSGLDADRGTAEGLCIRAKRTVSLAAMKKGFLNAASRQWTGEVTVKDIGFPKEIF